ncbi:putative receptor-like protein kinase [Carex littledalei]|uniref:Putative receptor-like protein kinase n=1 Tax=Carex littledalei TaxID=544730 RepID=A0A833QCE9_9POAL|nr:putative receptor-like protein kinase [Carex littledalei]
MASSSRRNSYLPNFLFLLLCMMFNLVASASDENPYVWLDCPTDSNFTLNSTYQSNLNSVLSMLPSSASPTGFTIAMHGDAPDQVFSRALCRGDLSPSKCQSCLATAAQGITSRCPVGKKAIIFYDKCSLRYSNSNYTTPEEKLWNLILYNVGTISDAQAFEKLYNDLIGSLAAKAANSSRKFAMSQADFTSDITMYGLAQCMRDLSVEECHTCLNQSMGYFQSCCNKNQGGVVLRYECYMRMEIYPYFDSNSEDVLSPPPLSIMSPPRPQSVPDSGIAPSPTEITGSKDKKKILPLVIVPSICGFIILMVALFCILRRRSMRQATCTSTNNEENSNQLFKLETLRIATNYFSPSNKLGEGGFGSVYKVWKEWCNRRALQVIDQRLHDSYRVYEALKCLTIALLCVQNDPSKRPNMASVSLMLSSNSMNTPTPSTPAFFIQDTRTTETEAENYDRQSRRGIGTRPNQISVNNVTITVMSPR